MLIWLAIIGYIISGGVALRGLSQASLPDRRWLFWPATLGAAAHLSTLASELIVFGALQVGFFNSASVITFFIVSTLLISGMTKPLHSLFAFVLPLAAVVLVVAVLAPQTQVPRVYSGGMLFHIFVSMLAYSVITIAAVLAVLLGIQNRQLHEHHPETRLNRVLPPLQSTERLMFEWLMIGFVLLTLAIVSGGLFVSNLFAQSLAHKTVLTLVAWVFFAALLFGHFHLGWRGARASKLTVSGFVFLMLAFFGSKFVLEYLVTAN
ncbi:MAG: cytochrome C assembly family protein [Saccharospirillum sp.]